MKEYEEGEEVAEEDMTEEGKEIKKQVEKERAEADDIEKEYRKAEKIWEEEGIEEGGIDPVTGGAPL